MQVLRRADDGRAAGLRWLRLLPLDRSGVGIFFEWREDPPPDIGDVFLKIRGGGGGAGLLLVRGESVCMGWGLALEGESAPRSRPRRR